MVASYINRFKTNSTEVDIQRLSRMGVGQTRSIYWFLYREANYFSGQHIGPTHIDNNLECDLGNYSPVSATPINLYTFLIKILPYTLLFYI